MLLVPSLLHTLYHKPAWKECIAYTCINLIHWQVTAFPQTSFMFSLEVERFMNQILQTVYDVSGIC